VRAHLIFCALVAVGCSHSTAHVPGSCDGPCPASQIRHLVVIVQENHTFDDHFGRYCTAPTGSNPSCTGGPGCCEAGPATDPTGALPINIDDAATGGYDPNHEQICEVDELDGGKMDKFVTSSVCGDARNFGYADPTIIAPYWTMAAKGALADRYFQPLAGASSANDMYLSLARYVFQDDEVEPDAIGKMCSFVPTVMEYPIQTIGDLLVQAGVSWAWYSEGYQAMVDASKLGKCPDAPDECGAGLSIYPCVFDPGDVPFDYEPKFKDNPTYLKDLAQLTIDLKKGQLPAISFIKAIGYKSEHPGLNSKLSDGVQFVDRLVAQLEGSAYQSDTLVLVTYDEGGGYFDHVAPPADSAVDGKPYGTRVPLLALGPFARTNFISHATMEHSSIVKFIEWNWLGQQTGQLGNRDTLVANLGSVLDPNTTGVVVPEQ
jgi:phospholipase C